MKLHLATALGALLLCLAGPALGQMPKGPVGPGPGPLPDIGPMPKIIDLSINKRVTGPVVAGQTATFVIEVTNSGNVAVNSGMGIQVIDPLPAGFTGSMTGAGFGWNCGQVGASLICKWIGGPVPAGAPFPPITMTAVAADREYFKQCARVVIGKGQDMRPGNNDDCVEGRIEKAKGGRYDVRIRKTGPVSVGVGQTATFTLQAINQGPSSVDGNVGLTVTDSVPATFGNVQANGVGWTCNVAGGQPALVTCTYTGAQVNATQQFPVITITGVAEMAVPWINCAEATFLKADDFKPDDNKSCIEGYVTKGDKKGYDVSIRKSYKPPSKPGGPATFQLYPYNNGPSAVSYSTGVQVTDTLPANFAPPITGVGTNWSCSTNGGPPWTVVCDYTGPSVGPGPLPPITITAAVKEPGKFENCAEILLRKETDLNPRDNNGCVQGEVTGGGRKPDVNITKTALKQPWAWPAGTGVYQFKITNVGDTAVPAGHTFTLTENLPAGMVLVSTPNAWSCSPGAGTVGPATVICTYVSPAALNPNAFIQFDMTVGFSGKKELRYQNCASVAVSGKDGPWREVNLENNSDCETTEVGGGGYFDIGVDKTGPSALTIGQTGTYTLAVTNASTTPLDLNTYNPPPYVTVYTPVITVTDTLPAMFDPPVSVNGGPNWNCTATGLTVSCTYIGGGIIPAGGPLPPITVSATVGSAGTLNNCAVATLGGGWFIVDVVSANNNDCVSVTVREPVQPPSLAINKTILDDCYTNNNGNDIRCTFLITVTNTGGSAWTGPVQFTDTIQPQGASNTVLVGGQPSGWTCTGSQPMVCNTNGSVTIGAGGSVTSTFTVDIMSPIIPTQNCASLTSPIAVGPVCVPLGDSAPASLEIEKVVDQDCSGTTPYTGCKFMIRIFNTGSTVYTGPLTFTDTVTGPSGITIGGVSLATPPPPGWTCNGSQPATCSITSATIPVNGHITIPLYMTINGAIPPQQNCAVLTAPVSAQSCVPMGNTHYDLGLDSNFVETFEAVNGGQFQFWVSSTPALINGSQLVFSGSVTTPATLTPSVSSATVLVDTPLWNCSGTWTGFICTLNVTPGAYAGALIPLKLKVYYSPNFAGQPMTFTGHIQMNGNADPVPSNNSDSVTMVLP